MLITCDDEDIFVPTLAKVLQLSRQDIEADSSEAAHVFSRYMEPTLVRDDLERERC